MRPITSSSDFAPLHNNGYKVYTNKELDEYPHDQNFLLELHCGFDDRDVPHAARRISLSDEPLFLTHVLPDGTFTNQAKALVVEDGKLQRVPPTIQFTFGQTPEGGTTMMVEDGGAGIRQQREFLVRVGKRIPLSADIYNLYHLSLDHHIVIEKLQSLDCSLTLAPDTRAVGSTTLLTTKDFLIPILEEVCPGASISKEFMRAWGEVELGVAHRRFLAVAVAVMRCGSPLAKQCYEKEVRLCGRVIEFTIMLSGGNCFDPRIVASGDGKLQGFRRMDNCMGHPNM